MCLSDTPLPGNPVIPSVTKSTIRVAYLIPSNRTAQPNAIATLRATMLRARSWFNDQFQRLGLPQRQLNFETEVDGVTPRVWVLDVPQTDAYIAGDMWGRVHEGAASAGITVFSQRQIWLLIPECHATAADGTITGGTALGAGNGSGLDGGAAHIGSDGLAVLNPAFLNDNRAYAGLVIPELGPNPLVQDKSFKWFEGTTLSSVSSSYVGATIHELLHALGMPHEARHDNNFHGPVMNNGLRGYRGAELPHAYPNDSMYLSYGMALAMNTSRYFNAADIPRETTIPSLTVSTSGAVTPVNGQLSISFTASDNTALSSALLINAAGNLISELPLSGSLAITSISTPHYNAGVAENYKLRVYDIYGNHRTSEVSITPSGAAPRAPRPFLRVSHSTAPAGQTFTLDAAQSTDSDSLPSQLRYQFDFNNDGVYDTSLGTSTLASVSFSDPGIRVFRVRVVDGNGTGLASVSMPVTTRIEAPPRVLTATFTPRADNHVLRVVFSKPLGNTVAAGDFRIAQGSPTGGSLVPATFQYDPATLTATLGWNQLAQSRYFLTIQSGDIADLFNVALDGDANGAAGGTFAFNFSYLIGDANNDARVDHADFNIFDANFGNNAASALQGDFNGDGKATFADFQILETAFGTSLAPPPALDATQAAAKNARTPKVAFKPFAKRPVFRRA